ncbi:hypothetical protein [Leptospira noguchii]|nr:hypothetical protein [Leptospira noguchii]
MEQKRTTQRLASMVARRKLSVSLLWSLDVNSASRFYGRST